jgi:transcriptional regulator with XRE-family HTH domain
MAHVGKYILRVVKEQKKSLRWLARESGVSNSYLSQLTRGMFKATPEVLIKVAPHLGLTAEDLFVEAGWLEGPKKGGAKKK